MERVEIATATAAQLRRFAQTSLGLEVQGNESKDRLLTMLATAGFSGSTIVLHDATPTPSGGPDRDRFPFNVREREDGVREFRITIHEQDKPGGSDPVPVGVNGRAMLIPRGTPQWVPEHFVEALNNAEEKIYPEYDPDVDGGIGGLREHLARNVKSYPFSYA